MAVDRRTVLAAGLAMPAAAAGGAGFAGSAQPVLPPALRGRLHFDAAARAEAADDFGHLVRKLPEGVLRSGSAEDIALAIRWVARRGRRFAARGRGHSVLGRPMAENGIVGDMSRLRAIHGIEGDRVTVDAGATWSEVLAATLPLGLGPPVLTDYLGLSVGGTLVVGGVGGTISRFGVQADNVLAMEVVTGTGRRLGCSPRRNRDLFDAVRAGLGQVAVVTRATLRLVPAPRQVRRFLLFYPSLRAMLHDQRLLARDDRFDAVQGAVLPAQTGGWTYRLEAVKHVEGTPPDDRALLAGLSDDRARRQPGALDYFDHLDRLSKLEAALRANGQWFLPHPWLATFVGDSAVEAVVGRELAGLGPADLGAFGQVVLSAFRRQAVTAPLLRLPADGLCFAFNLVRIPATGRIAEVGRLMAANRAVYARIRDAGGTLYPVSALPMSRDEWRRHFGPAFARLSAAKRKFDPGNVLTPGYPVF